MKYSDGSTVKISAMEIKFPRWLTFLKTNNENKILNVGMVDPERRIWEA